MSDSGKKTCILSQVSHIISHIMRSVRHQCGVMVNKLVSLDQLQLISECHISTILRKSFGALQHARTFMTE